MNIVFLAPLSEDTKQRDTYDVILKLSEKQKQTIFDGSHLPKKATETEIQNHFNAIISEIKQADGIIVEATIPDFDLGHFVSSALQQHKPILLLYRNDLSRSFAFGASRLVSKKQYSTSKLADLEKDLQTFFAQVKEKKLLYRFNLMLSRDINMFLMDKAKDNNVSKADYIRDLIIRDMNRAE